MFSQVRVLSCLEFLKVAATALGGLVSTGCRGGQVVQVTASPVPTGIAAARAATAAPGAAGPFVEGSGVADSGLVNGKVVTMDASSSTVQAVAVKNGFIVQRGTDQAIRALVGPQTQVVDLRGRTLTPGLIDSHNHLQIQGLRSGYFVQFLPPKVTSVKDLQTSLAETLAKTPKGQWIQGFWLSMADGRTPNRHDLDRVSPDHPSWIMQQAGHFGTLNSVALKIAGITAATANPTGGIIERDSSGAPTGVHYNHRATDLFRASIPARSPDEGRNSILTA